MPQESIRSVQSFYSSDNAHNRVHGRSRRREPEAHLFYHAWNPWLRLAYTQTVQFSQHAL